MVVRYLFFDSPFPGGISINPKTRGRAVMVGYVLDDGVVVCFDCWGNSRGLPTPGFVTFFPFMKIALLQRYIYSYIFESSLFIPLLNPTFYTPPSSKSSHAYTTPYRCTESCSNDVPTSPSSEQKARTHYIYRLFQPYHPINSPRFWFPPT